MPFGLRDGDARFLLLPDQAEATTLWCKAIVPISLEMRELERLSQGIRQLATDGHGAYLWQNDGGEVRIEIVMAKRDETHTSIRLQAAPDFLHELRLVFVGRQSSLLDLADEVTRP